MGRPAVATAPVAERPAERSQLAGPAVAGRVTAQSGVHSAARPSQPPILASSVIRAEVAPLFPGRTAVRGVLFVGAVALLTAGLAWRFDSEPAPQASVIALMAAAVLALTAALPFPYAWRASLAAATPALLFSAGAMGVGPLAPVADGAGAARLAAWIALPAALMFRSSYRASTAARGLLAAAFVASVPCLAIESALIVRGEPGAVVAATPALVALLCGLFGFADGKTTAGGFGIAALILVGAGFRLAWVPAVAGSWNVATIGLVVCGLAAVAAFGVYQLAAWRFGHRERARLEASP